jgi:hypothetical protein
MVREFLLDKKAEEEYFKVVDAGEITVSESAPTVLRHDWTAEDDLRSWESQSRSHKNFRSQAPRMPRRYVRRAPRSRRASRPAARSGDVSDGCSSDPERQPTDPSLSHLFSLRTLATRWLTSYKTLANRFSEDPAQFPPALKLPGCAGPRFTLAAVLAFERLAISSVKHCAPRRRGRPRTCHDEVGSS